MSVLITGASGLLGRYIIKELLDLGKTPIGLDITPPNLSLNCFFAEGSILDKELLARICKQNSVKEIIHLAALLQFGCEREPQHAIDVNVQGTLNVLETARRTGVKNFVFASSGAVYGPTQDDIDEMTPTYPGVSLYGVTKLLAEKVGGRMPSNMIFHLQPSDTGQSMDLVK